MTEYSPHNPSTCGAKCDPNAELALLLRNGHRRDRVNPVGGLTGRPPLAVDGASSPF
jgi:hypothetical protein